MTKSSQPNKTKKTISGRARSKKSPNLWGKFISLPKPLLIGAWVIIFGAIGVKAIFFTQAATFQEVGLHPQASIQTSGAGKVIRSVTSFNGRVYGGFGDYGANTGPIALTPKQFIAFGR